MKLALILFAPPTTLAIGFDTASLILNGGTKSWIKIGVQAINSEANYWRLVINYSQDDTSDCEMDQQEDC